MPMVEIFHYKWQKKSKRSVCNMTVGHCYKYSKGSGLIVSTIDITFIIFLQIIESGDKLIRMLITYIFIAKLVILAFFKSCYTRLLHIMYST